MGVSVDGGGSNDMAVAFEGGTKFTDRLNQLADAKAQHDAALAALQEGQAVKFSIQQADELTAKSKMEAEERIAAAKAEADEIVRDARRAAQADSDQANGERNAAKREIAELRAAHDAYVAGTRAEIDRLLAQAKADSDAAAQGRATMQAERDELTAAQTAAQGATADATAERQRYDAAMAHLRDAIAVAADLAAKAPSA